jgi:hypothetical protein
VDRVPHLPDHARPAPFAAAGDGTDWGATPFGPVETWPQSLKTAASIVLGSTLPMFLGWGPDFRMLYNQAYAEILGDRGPAHGKPGREVWRDVWDRIRVRDVQDARVDRHGDGQSGEEILHARLQPIAL